MLTIFTVNENFNFILKMSCIVHIELYKSLSFLKETGDKATLQKWSRGLMVIVRGGGHIEYWDSIYKVHQMKLKTKQNITKIAKIFPNFE